MDIVSLAIDKNVTNRPSNHFFAVTSLANSITHYVSERFFANAHAERLHL